MKKYLITIFILLLPVIYLMINTVSAEQNLAQKLSGRILLQVQSLGQAWYINPADNKKYSLGRPKEALDLMRNLSIGITNNNLAKIPIGLLDYNDIDDDNDGLTNRLENALGTNASLADSDGDGYNDKSEIENNYDPLSNNILNIDAIFAKKNAGKIFLQVENSGQAWYVNPLDNKRYYLGRPADAFAVMRRLSLGITDNNLNKILPGYFTPPIKEPIQPPEKQPSCKDCQSDSADQIFNAAASAIRSGNTAKALTYFTPEVRKAVEYTMNFLDSEGKLTLGNIMSGAKLSSSTNAQKIYTAEVYFSLGGYKVPVSFYVKKQPDGKWLVANL